MLKPEATFMLLRLIELNGGQIHRGDLNATLNRLQDLSLVDVKFTPEKPSNHTEYDFILTESGSKELEFQKALKVKQLEVKEIRRKKGRATLIEYKGGRYAWQHPEANKTKNWAGQNFPDSKY